MKHRLTKIASHFFYPFVAEVGSRITAEGWKNVFGKGLDAGAVYNFDGKNCHIYRLADQMAEVKPVLLEFVQRPDFKEKTEYYKKLIPAFLEELKKPDATFESVLQAAMNPYAMSAACFMPINLWSDELPADRFEEIGQISLDYRTAADVIMPAYQEWALAYLERNGYGKFAVSKDVAEGNRERSAQRENGWIFAYNEYYTEPWAQIKETFNFETDDEEVVADAVTEVTGKSVFAGVVRGPVRHAYSPLDFAAVQHGDILVTTMTSPQFAPIFPKVIAIVTDEGGVTCHAAITARELAKPCITGTRIATKVFKDGDMVEVDAVNGIIKKL